MRIALIRNGVVENVVEADEDLAPAEGALAVPAQNSGPRWTYDGANFHAPYENASVPDSVTMFQAREQLRRTPAPSGGTLLDSVNAYVESRSGEEPTLALAWEYATEVHRAGAFVAALASVFSLSDEALDELFRQAATITA